jgi:hypothetical protein
LHIAIFGDKEYEEKVPEIWELDNWSLFQEILCFCANKKEHYHARVCYMSGTRSSLDLKTIINM